jgi:hypothetical protein
MNEKQPFFLPFINGLTPHGIACYVLNHMQIMDHQNGWTANTVISYSPEADNSNVAVTEKIQNIIYLLSQAFEIHANEKPAVKFENGAIVMDFFKVNPRASDLIGTMIQSIGSIKINQTTYEPQHSKLINAALNLNFPKPEQAFITFNIELNDNKGEE